MTSPISETKPISHIPKNKYQEVVEEMFSMAGIRINGSRPFDIQVNNINFYKRMLSDGTLGLGESYMDRWWECQNIPKMMGKLANANLQKRFNKSFKLIILFSLANLSSLVEKAKTKSLKVGKQHYDIGNDLFQFMLDPRLIYSCGYWKNAQNLKEAQEAKLDLICTKIGLKPKMKVLDIGCGWGGFAKFAAEKYGAEVTGITISEEQVKLAKEICNGLSVKIKFQDYRDVQETFDRIVSIGMFEHVGHEHYRTFMEVVHRCLKENGLFLLHTIGGNRLLTKREAPWIFKYIFPNSEIPSIKHIGGSIEDLFVMEDWQNFGTDYYKTLMAWYDNFVNNWNELKPRYGERFFRMWEYYLLVSAGLFQSRFTQLWQIVLSKKGIPSGYQKNVHYTPYHS